MQTLQFALPTLVLSNKRDAIGLNKAKKMKIPTVCIEAEKLAGCDLNIEAAIQKELENREFEILSSGFERIPQTLTKLNAEQIEEVEKLIEKLEEDDDVQNVYHNMDTSE